MNIKDIRICVLGMGYVGLPVALAFAKKFKVTGFDINPGKISQLQNFEDPSEEIDFNNHKDADITFTASEDQLKSCNFFIVAVPTPIDEFKTPFLKPLLGACETLGRVIHKGDFVVFESTVYPGCTEEECVPVIERRSGLRYKEDFKVGYSPERINPGDKAHTIEKIKKVVSGCDDETKSIVSEVYGNVIDAGIHIASNIKVAEAAKVIENTQSDLNIALMNELSVIFNKMHINTYDVLEAAGTKWNFLGFYPGLVGGHCIGVDPYYLTHKANKLGYHPRVILSGRRINDEIPSFIAKDVVHHLIDSDKSLKRTKVLVLGITFKENVKDIRNSKVADLIKELRTYLVNVEIYDPKADSKEVEDEYGFTLNYEIGNNYDGIIMAVNHKEFLNYDEDFFYSISANNGIFFDVKGIYKNKISKLTYRSL